MKLSSRVVIPHVIVPALGCTYTPAATDRNVLGTAGSGYSGVLPSVADLAEFMCKYRFAEADAAGATFIVVQVNGWRSLGHGASYSARILQSRPWAGWRRRLLHLPALRRDQHVIQLLYDEKNRSNEYATYMCG
ncbi:hypothetical protein H4582DRAFT_719559 [Lactarius indigo]|nr:hypothetical protein H4582DRAFT_719559 [Lactarius indigo]